MQPWAPTEDLRPPAPQSAVALVPLGAIRGGDKRESWMTETNKPRM